MTKAHIPLEMRNAVDKFDKAIRGIDYCSRPPYTDIKSAWKPLRSEYLTAAFHVQRSKNKVEAAPHLPRLHAAFKALLETGNKAVEGLAQLNREDAERRANAIPFSAEESAKIGEAISNYAASRGYSSNWTGD